MDEKAIKSMLSKMAGYNSIFVPEFTWRNKRLDAIIIDLEHRWVRGFEIKTSRGDFLQDRKFWEYSEFCSSLSFVCPARLIKPDEVEKPIGLLWIEDPIDPSNQHWRSPYVWKKRPMNFQLRKSLSWLWTYVRVIEKEFPRLQWEIDKLTNDFKRINK